MDNDEDRKNEEIGDETGHTHIVSGKESLHKKVDKHLSQTKTLKDKYDKINASKKQSSAPKKKEEEQEEAAGYRLLHKYRDLNEDKTVELLGDELQKQAAKELRQQKESQLKTLYKENRIIQEDIFELETQLLTLNISFDTIKNAPHGVTLANMVAFDNITQKIGKLEALQKSNELTIKKGLLELSRMNDDETGHTRAIFGGEEEEEEEDTGHTNFIFNEEGGGEEEEDTGHTNFIFNEGEGEEEEEDTGHTKFIFGEGEGEETGHTKFLLGGGGDEDETWKKYYGKMIKKESLGRQKRRDRKKK